MNNFSHIQHPELTAADYAAAEVQLARGVPFDTVCRRLSDWAAQCRLEAKAYNLELLQFDADH